MPEGIPTDREGRAIPGASVRGGGLLSRFWGPKSRNPPHSASRNATKAKIPSRSLSTNESDEWTKRSTHARPRQIAGHVNWPCSSCLAAVLLGILSRIKKDHKSGGRFAWVLFEAAVREPTDVISRVRIQASPWIMRAFGVFSREAGTCWSQAPWCL